jgi:hypothetical protein
MPPVTENDETEVIVVELTIEDRLDYIARRVDFIAAKIAEFEANIGPALAAVSNGGIFSMLTGRTKK